MSHRFTSFFAGALLGASLIGCASAPSPIAPVTRAQVLIDQAERAGAQRHAAADIERARDRLREARAAVQRDEPRQAVWRAEESAADARLALARVESAQAQSAAEEVARSVEVLRRESARKLQALGTQALGTEVNPSPARLLDKEAGTNAGAKPATPE